MPSIYRFTDRAGNHTFSFMLLLLNSGDLLIEYYIIIVLNKGVLIITCGPVNNIIQNTYVSPIESQLIVNGFYVLVQVKS